MLTKQHHAGFPLTRTTYRDFTVSFCAEHFKFKFGAHGMALMCGNTLVSPTYPSPKKPTPFDIALDDETGNEIPGKLMFPREEPAEGQRAADKPMTYVGQTKFNEANRTYILEHDRAIKDWTTLNAVDNALGTAIITSLSQSTINQLQLDPEWIAAFKSRTPITTPIPCFAHDIFKVLEKTYSGGSAANILHNVSEALNAKRPQGTSTYDALNSYKTILNKAISSLDGGTGIIKSGDLAAMLLQLYFTGAYVTPSEKRAKRRILAFKRKPADSADTLTTSSTAMMPVEEQTAIFLEELTISSAACEDDTPTTMALAATITVTPLTPTPDREPRARRNYKIPDPTKPVGSHCPICYKLTLCYFYHTPKDCKRKTTAAAAPAALLAGTTVAPDFTQSAAFAAAVATATAASDAAHAKQLASYQQQLNSHHAQSHDLLLALLGSTSSAPDAI
jgi:hypothetical protein